MVRSLLSTGTVTGSLGSFESVTGTTLGVSGDGSVLGVLSTGTITGSLGSLKVLGVSGKWFGPWVVEHRHSDRQSRIF